MDMDFSWDDEDENESETSGEEQSTDDLFEHLGESDDTEEEVAEDNGDTKSVSKAGAIVAVIGVVLILGIVILATQVKGCVSGDKTTQQTQTTVVKKSSSSGSSSSSQSSQQPTKVVQVVENKPTVVADWTELLDSTADVKFQDEYKELTFVVLEIHHYARKTSDSTLGLKTTITGSLSGLSGTYEMDIPYNKGIKLRVGTEFTVKVQIGEYNGKTVVGEIRAD